MFRTSPILRTALAAGAALAMATLSAAPANARPAPEPFKAEYRDQCVHAATNGNLGWPGTSYPVPTPGVAVDGVVTERHFCTDPPLRYVYAEFVAYVDGTAVDRRIEPVIDEDDVGAPEPGDGQRAFQFVLSNTTSNAPIEQVDVRVCRDFGPWLPAFQCGDTESYFAPGVTPPPSPAMAGTQG